MRSATAIPVTGPTGTGSSPTASTKHRRRTADSTRRRRPTMPGIRPPNPSPGVLPKRGGSWARSPVSTTTGMEGMTLGGASTTPVLSPTGIPATAAPRLAAGGKPLRGRRPASATCTRASFPPEGELGRIRFAPRRRGRRRPVDDIQTQSRRQCARPPAAARMRGGRVRPLALPVMTAPVRCGNRTEILNAWFSPEKAGEVREAANADGVSVSHLMRNAALREARTRLSESSPRGRRREREGTTWLSFCKAS